MTISNLKSTEPLISVITPCHNAEKWIEQTIQSVLTQTFEDFEIIIADDGSTDKSKNILQSLIKKDNRIKLITLEKCSGTATARNTALKMAQGKYIAFLDADDIWLENKLETQISFMEQGNHALCFTAYEKIDDKGVLVGEIGVPRIVNYQTLLKTNVMGCSTVIYDSHYFGKVEMPLIKKRQDFALWLNLLKKVEFAYGINTPLTQYRIHNNTLSSNKLSAAIFTWVLFRRIEKLPLLSSSYYFCHYAIRGLLRYYLPRIAKVLGVLRRVE